MFLLDYAPFVLTSWRFSHSCNCSLPQENRMYRPSLKCGMGSVVRFELVRERIQVSGTLSRFANSAESLTSKDMASRLFLSWETFETRLRAGDGNAACRLLVLRLRRSVISSEEMLK